MTDSTTTQETPETTTTTETPATTKRTTRYRNQNFETKVGKCDFLLSALTDQSEEALSRFGIVSTSIDTFREVIGRVKNTDKRQEGLKAELKTESALLRKEMEEMENQYATLKKKVKAEVPMEDWKRFGIYDKQ